MHMALVMAVVGSLNPAIALADPGTAPEATPVPSPEPEPPHMRGVPPGFDDAIQVPQGTDAGSPGPASHAVAGAHPTLPSHADPGLPLQLTLSAGTNRYRNHPVETAEHVSLGALWLGVPLTAPWSRGGGFFVAPGAEATLEGAGGPYEWSIGGGVRAGYLWRGAVEPFPAAYLYGRVTPFMGMRTISDPEYLHATEHRLTSRGYGVRLGVGVVAPIWSRLMAEGFGSFDPGSLRFDRPEEALACLGFVAVAILTNHVELTYESYVEPGVDPVRRAGFRVGTGF